ncbi:hypothetical protein KI387_014082, partial [Taxus chinensis]
YEALILGLQAAEEKGIKNLEVFGDAELIVKQERNQFQVKNDHLRHYRNKVWDEIEAFDAFFLKSVPRKKNDKADSLVDSSSLMIPHLEFDQVKYTIEM